GLIFVLELIIHLRDRSFILLQCQIGSGGMPAAHRDASGHCRKSFGEDSYDVLAWLQVAKLIGTALVGNSSQVRMRWPRFHHDRGVGDWLPLSGCNVTYDGSHNSLPSASCFS